MHTQIIRIMFLVTLLFSCQPKQSVIDKTTIKELDLERYMGTWYEIARFPHSFEKDLVGVTASYHLRADGKIDVINAGYKNSLNGPYQEAKGKAKMPNPEKPGELKVAFFLFFYADYNILELADDYSYALIGSSSPKYLWILSRTPQLEETTYQQLVQEAQKRGYDTSQLIRVPQK
ncbi:lipocalin family protein [Sunxiuqinia elliptica]